jgi:hypothetical protein
MKMTTIRRIFLLAALLFLWSKASAVACKCPSVPVAERFVSASCVFSATVQYRGNQCIENIMDVDNHDDTRNDYRYFQYVVLKITKIWKGNLPEKVLIIQSRTSCYFSFFTNDEYVVFAGLYSEPDNCDSIFKNIVSLTTSQCRHNRYRSGTLSASLDSLVSLSNIMYEVQEVQQNLNYLYYTLQSDFKFKYSMLGRTDAFNRYGQSVSGLGYFERWSVRIPIHKNTLSNSVYFFRHHTDTNVTVLPFIYYEDRFYYTDQRLSWK